MKKSLAISAVTLLVATVLTGIVLAKQGQKGALAITTDPSNVRVSVNRGSILIVEKYSPFWTGDLTPGNYLVTATFTNPTKVVSETVTVIAGRTAPVHLSVKAHEEIPVEMKLEVDKTSIKTRESATITITLLNTSSGKPLNQPCVVNLSTTLGSIVSSVEVVGTAQVTFTSQNPGTATLTARTNVGAKDLKESVEITVVNPFTCGEQIQDADGNTYNTVLIGSQCWMKENFRGTHYADGSFISGQGNPKTTPPAAYPRAPTVEGLLYNCNDAMYKTLLSGWHIPTDAEIKKLEMYLGMTQAQADATGYRGTDQGTQLKKGGSSGFEALLAGYRVANGAFGGRNECTYLWSSTWSGSGTWWRWLGSSEARVYRAPYDEMYSFSVRCLKD